MIAVSSITLGDMVNAVYSRVASYVTTHNFDWGEVVQYIIDARRELFVKTSPYYEWSYYNTVDINHLDNIPQDYIRPVRLWTRAQGSVLADAEWVEARRTDPREWRRLTSTAMQLSYVAATANNPVYMVWANNDGTSTWASTNMALWLFPTTLIGRLDYVASYAADDLNEASDLLRVPTVMQSLLIDMATLRVLQDVLDTGTVGVVARRVYDELATFQISKAATLDAEATTNEATPDAQPAKVIPVSGGGQ